MNKYLTDLAKEGRGQDVSRTLERGVKYVHDIFQAAADERLDIWMLCGSLRERLRDDYYRQITKKSFTDSVRGVLAAGGNVSIFLWNDPTRQGVVSPSLWALIDEAATAPSGWGVLEILASGRSEGGEEIPHFVLAKDRDSRTWILRLEQPHAPLGEQAMLNDRLPQIPAAIFFRTEDAKRQGSMMLKVYEKLANSAVCADRGATANELHHAGCDN